MIYYDLILLIQPTCNSKQIHTQWVQIIDSVLEVIHYISCYKGSVIKRNGPTYIQMRLSFVIPEGNNKYVQTFYGETSPDRVKVKLSLCLTN
jgi:hypothetical protein